MATISIVKEPQDKELAYGPIVVTLYDGDEDGFTYALKIFDKDDNLVAFLQQQPNLEGYAHFKIDRFLSKQVETDPAIPESTNLYRYSRGETFPYYLSYGYIDDSGVYQEADTTDFKLVWNGRKNYYDIDWEFDLVVPEVGTFAGQVSRNRDAGPLTDNANVTFGTLITDGRPNSAEFHEIYIFEKDKDSDATITFLNAWEGTTISTFNGMNGYDVTIYSGSTELNSYSVENLTLFGGGPNTLFDDSIIPTGSNGQYSWLTMDVGADNGNISGYPTATHYYIHPWCYTNTTPAGKTYIYKAARYNIRCKEGLDYPIMQVAWVNSYGAWDYFDFVKRNEYTANFNRETYVKENNTWSGTTFAVNAYDRGEKVFNTNMTETYKATTHYITDEQAKFLKNLFASPAVQVKLPDSDVWQPVILTSNSYTEKSFRKDRLFQYEIQFTMATKQSIQQQ